jgi:hypothetical protein
VSSPTPRLAIPWASTTAPAKTIATRAVGDDHVTAAEEVVVGTLLLEPVLLAIRRVAQANVSLRTRGRR